jgi:hypothetical protein
MLAMLPMLFYRFPLFINYSSPLPREFNETVSYKIKERRI